MEHLDISNSAAEPGGVGGQPLVSQAAQNNSNQGSSVAHNVNIMDEFGKWKFYFFSAKAQDMTIFFLNQ